MASKSISMFVFICSLLLASSLSEASFGGWQTITNLTDPKVVEIAEFAVKQHNMRVNLRLKLVVVVKGETQLVNGENYRLVISARDVLKTANYRVVVWDKPSTKERKLTSFEEIA